MISIDHPRPVTDPSRSLEVQKLRHYDILGPEYELPMRKSEKIHVGNYRKLLSVFQMK